MAHMQREARVRACVSTCTHHRRACAGEPAVSFACNHARSSDLCGAKETIYFHCSQRGGPGRAESITIPSIHSCGSNMDIIYMVMRARWPPRVTPWTSLTVDSSGVPWHPNGMRRRGRTHTHTNTECVHRVDRQGGGMFQLADADRRRAAFARLGEKVECVALCRPPLFSSLLSFLLFAQVKESLERGKGEERELRNVSVSQR